MGCGSGLITEADRVLLMRKREAVRTIQTNVIGYMCENLIDEPVTGRHHLGKALRTSPVGKQGAMLDLANYVSGKFKIPLEDVTQYEGRIDGMTLTQSARLIYDSVQQRRAA